MRIVLFLNNWGGWQVASWLRQRAEQIVGLVLQPPDDRRFAEETLAALDMPRERIWTADRLRSEDTLAQLRDLRPDIGVAAFFAYILKPELVGLFPKGCINLHSAYLPYNRGWHTNVWPILEGTPAGATIHYIDAGVDTGDIIAQRQFSAMPTDTGGSLHERITTGLIKLFQETWPLIRAGRNTRHPQEHVKATVHKKAALAEISEIQLDRSYTVGGLIDLLRARTYPPYPSAYFVEAGRRSYLRLALRSETRSYASEAPEALHGEEIDLNTRLPAREILERLGVGRPRGSRQAYFQHGDERIHVNAYAVDEREISTQATPAWMAGSAPPNTDGKPRIAS